MSGTRAELPEGRYGRSADARADRTLKIVGAVLGTALLAVIGWSGFSYIAGEAVSGEVIKSKVVTDSAVEVHLEVRKDAHTDGVCTVRSLAEDGSEVGRKDIRFEERRSRVDKVATVRTTGRATATELVDCSASAASG
ncbi:DUF4307 domain-containing protein [Streptomyces sp. bgisy100]|uniref:DUF4307 domain-containing protein n=1 Tax=Streptomyces sp. bgisy100 TaxID=3413783 RepID=UPI003D709258